jgi:hypothetical protein
MNNTRLSESRIDPIDKMHFVMRKIIKDHGFSPQLSMMLHVGETPVPGIRHYLRPLKRFVLSSKKCMRALRPPIDTTMIGFSLVVVVDRIAYSDDDSWPTVGYLIWFETPIMELRWFAYWEARLCSEPDVD